MDKLIDYYMTPVSPYVYLGHERFVAIANKHRATIAVKPINLGVVFPVSGGLPLAKRAPQRQAYRLVELTRWSRHLGVPLNLHPAHFPVPADLASRFLLAALERSIDAALALALAMSRAVWRQERDISDAATLMAISAECGGDGAALAARAASADSAPINPINLPCRAGLVEPPTGHSTIAASLARTLAASASSVCGRTVLISMNNLPCTSPASSPDAPP